MAHSINDLLVSDMTLMWPSDAKHDSRALSVGDIVPCTWEGEVAQRVKAGPPGPGGQSFLDLLTSFDKSGHQRAQSGCGCNARLRGSANTGSSCCPHSQRDQTQDATTTKGPLANSLWYNYCKSVVDARFDWVASVPTENLYKSEQTVEVDSATNVRGAEASLLLEGERLIKGLFIHPQILTGFRYIVRQCDKKKPMFDGRALQLTNIGCGYGKRVTFESDSKLSNDNYFYCDTHPAGYGLRLVAMEKGDSFTLRDSMDSPVGFLVVEEMKEQLEVRHQIRSNKQVEKRVRVTFRGRVDMFASRGETECSVSGRAVLLREKPGAAARLLKVIRCKIEGEDQSYTLVPGIDETDRVSVVSGEDIGDIPASYSVKGLRSHELPVIGTYVHPEIIVGAKYKVRSLANNKYLFGGKALKLESIGKGYGKRITFEGESLLHNDNYFYSDTNEEGWAFTVEAVSVGDQFRLVNSAGEDVGSAEVFRADAPQKMLECHSSTNAIVRATVTCHFTMHGRADSVTTTVSGDASLTKSRSGIRVSVTNLSFGGLLSHLSTEGLSLVDM